MNLNVGVCVAKQLAVPYRFDCLNIDIIKSSGVAVACDVHNLPFKDGAFKDVFCFHVLEHIDNPGGALSELVRVARRLVELEVPHRFGVHAKSQVRDRFKVNFFHVCSFRVMWFHNCLRNFKHCVKVYWEFPFDLLIHVWVYKEGWHKIE